MHPEIDQKVKSLVRELEHLYGERLLSVCVYGSSLFKRSCLN
jgi:hypothetical protein